LYLLTAIIKGNKIFALAREKEEREKEGKRRTGERGQKKNGRKREKEEWGRGREKVEPYFM